MLYPSNFDQKVGFDTIKTAISNFCVSEMGRQYCAKIAFSTSKAEIQKLSGQVAEFVQILAEQLPFPEQHYYNIGSFLDHAKLEGALLSDEAFNDIRRTLQTINQCKTILEKRQKAPLLAELAGAVNIDIELLKAIQKIIDENGKVRDHASNTLFEIRKELIAEQTSLRKKLDSFLRKLQENSEAPNDLTLTVRNGRLVVPVFAEYKRKVKGLIYDESNTGQTVFMEPLEAFEANNRIRELENDEKRELIRLFSELTTKLRQQVPELKIGLRFLGLVDAVRAKAKFCTQINGQLPHISDSTCIKWNDVVHPVLYLHQMQSGKQTVPLQLHLDTQNRILVVSGPNAGGKSVMLKTVALIQYMFQCGLLIPNGEKCTCAIFNKICIDIGDEQSIDSDLSTYSSHLKNMKAMLELANERTLVLIDEFGTGTDPQYGGALAEAILEQLHIQNVFGVVNTHYSNLKYFAQHTNGVLNGAMLFDYEHLTPMYELAVGKPGNSFAFEIAEKIGLDDVVLQRARGKIGPDKLKADALVKELQIEKQRLSKEAAALQTQRKNLERVTHQYEELKLHIEQSKSEQLQKAKTEARQLILNARTTIDATLKQLKASANVEQARIQNAKGKVAHIEKELGIQGPSPEPIVLESTTDHVFAKGQKVYFKGQEGVFTILNIKGADVELTAGDLKINTKLNRIVPAPNQAGNVKKATVSFKNGSISDRMVQFEHTLDVRGSRASEVLNTLELYLDEALLVGATEVRILHGKGDGILRTNIREHLKRLPYVANFTDEKESFGGAGVTVVTLNR